MGRAEIKDSRPQPLGARAAGGSCPIGVSATPVLPTVALMQKHEDGEIVFRHACKLGLEGIVSKRKDSTYRSGRSPDWLKMKNPGC
jgi:bifunctional non-homologous end joining protein LigD